MARALASFSLTFLCCAVLPAQQSTTLEEQRYQQQIAHTRLENIASAQQQPNANEFMNARARKLIEFNEHWHNFFDSFRTKDPDQYPGCKKCDKAFSILGKRPYAQLRGQIATICMFAKEHFNSQHKLTFPLHKDYEHFASLLRDLKDQVETQKKTLNNTEAQKFLKKASKDANVLLASVDVLEPTISQSERILAANK